MRSWPCVRKSAASSLIAVLLATGASPAPACGAPAKKKSQEASLAGLRPGKDKLKTAVNIHGPYYRKAVPDSDSVLVWIDAAKHRSLRVEVDSQGVIRSVMVSAIDPLISDESQPVAALPSRTIATGKGLRIGYNVHDDVTETYGDPDGAANSVRYGHTVKVLSYSFEKSPQTMEFLCQVPGGRLLQVTLAAGGS